MIITSSLGILSVCAVMVIFTGAADRGQLTDGTEFFTAENRQLRIEKVCSGQIEPLKTHRVHSGCYWSTSILTIVPEGTWVQKGDVVCRLDSAEVAELAREREVRTITADARLETAQQGEQLVESDNARRVDSAEFRLQSAEMDLQVWEEAEFPRQLEELRSELSLAMEQYEAARDEYEFQEDIWEMGFAPGSSLATASRDQLLREEQRRKIQGQLTLLESFEAPRKTRQLQHSRNHAKREVARTHLRNGLAETKARLATLTAERKRMIYDRYYRWASDAEKACTVLAPCDGQVLYGNSWDSKSRGITSIEAGKTVKFRQLLFEIPDLSQFIVTLGVHESLYPCLTIGSAVSVRVEGIEEPVAGRIHKVSHRPKVVDVYNPSVREFQVEVFLEATPEQHARLVPKQSVDVVLTLANQADVLQIPEDAVMSFSGSACVWVRSGDDLSLRPIRPGRVSNGFVEILDGITAGESVVRNPGTHLLSQAESVVAGP